MAIQKGFFERMRRSLMRTGTIRLGRVPSDVDREPLQSFKNRHRLVDQAAMQPSKSEVRRAIAELRHYSDSLLDDIGINRGDIEQAVRKGRFEARSGRAAA